MSAKRDVHVVPYPNGWAVKREGASRASSLHPTQTKAESAGRTTAQRQQVELVIHRPNGRIRDSDSFGRDSNPPRDRNH
ncbi:DUF2188 domain-containing protein [Gemmatimonas sp.]|uniref:DUF2188 domain-containing protein n=1 Tax=Gemmatimonas sp. TaxID=1962908 RepID=UPI003F7176A2